MIVNPNQNSNPNPPGETAASITNPNVIRDLNTNNNNNNCAVLNNNNNNKNIKKDYKTNNNNINTGSTGSNLTTHQSSQCRYSPTQSSPAMADTSNTISFATLNVRGLNSPSKFDAIFEDFFREGISVIGLQETRLQERSAIAMFKEHCANIQNTYPYKAYWSYDPDDRAGGVGLIIASFISKYVQKIHRHKSKFIAIDIYLPGNEKAQNYQHL